MSRSLELFNAPDLDLYFRGTYVRNVDTGKIGIVDRIDGTGLRLDGSVVTSSLQDWEQFWPKTRALTIRVKAGLTGTEKRKKVYRGVYISKVARRQSRRSCYPNGIGLMFPSAPPVGTANMHTREVLQESVDLDNSLNLHFQSLLRRWENMGLKDSTSVGTRLIFVKTTNDRAAVHHGLLGRCGTFTFSNRTFRPSAKNDKTDRVAGTIERLLRTV